MTDETLEGGGDGFLATVHGPAERRALWDYEYDHRRIVRIVRRSVIAASVLLVQALGSGAAFLSGYGAMHAVGFLAAAGAILIFALTFRRRYLDARERGRSRKPGKPTHEHVSYRVEEGGLRVVNDRIDALFRWGFLDSIEAGLPGVFVRFREGDQILLIPRDAARPEPYEAFLGRLRTRVKVEDVL